ncbi:MAG: hypothetical protein ACLFPF_10685 [Halanaerobiales bacterium]
MIRKFRIIFYIILVLLILTSCQSGYNEIKLQSGKIAFISSRNNKLEIFIADEYGNNVKKIMDTDNHITNFSISPDRRYLILNEAKKKNNRLNGVGLYLLNLESGTKRLIDEGGSHPAWSPNGKRFVYERSTPDGGFVVVNDPLLNNEKVLFNSGDYIIPVGCSWSPDGSELLLMHYASMSDGRFLKVYNIEEDRFREIKLDLSKGVFNAEWSPIGHIIAAGLNSPTREKNEIILIDADTRKITHLTTIENALHYSLSWSPDGKKILYHAIYKPQNEFQGTWPRSDDNMDVYLYDIGNNETRNISNSDSTDIHPQWIP